MVRGTAPKANYGGRVMCFVETGHGKATSLRFDYENPPQPPQPNRGWHMAKWLFNRAYWETVPQGRLPENVPGMKTKEPKEA
jgi:sulfide:quinone oxidoreductase